MITNCEGQRFWCLSPPCPAPAGKYCSGGTIDNFIISECPAGFYCYSNYYEYPDNKMPCPSGQTSPAGSSSRSACYTECKAPAGSYCPSVNGTPIVCPPGTTSPAGSTSETACCPIGYDCTSGPPYPCKSGYWRYYDMCVPCQICSPGHLTIQTCINEINTECTECPAGTYCPTTSTSIICPYHKYCPLGVAAPIPCPTEMQSKLGSINITDCTSSKLGWYSNEASLILPCPINYYKNTEDFSPCTQCQQGWFALDEGASTCMQCSQGMYPNISAGICQACQNTCNSLNATSIHCMGNGTTVCCGPNTYFIDGVSTKCMPCDQGSYSLDGAGSACTLCPENSKKSNSTVCECDLTQGVYSYDVTLNTCIPCPENFYCTAQQSFIQCPAGTNRPLGQLPINTCSNCTNPPLSGEYVWVDTGLCAFQCKAGYYMDIWGDDTFCNECTQNFTCNPGQTTPSCMSTCSMGWYVPMCTQGSSSDNQCQQCPPIPPNAIRTSLCDFACPAGYFYNTASKLCSMCSKPICSPGQYATNCSKEADSVCVACTNQPTSGSVTYSSRCNFTCNGNAFFNATQNSCAECPREFYRSTPTTCSRCTVSQCAPGMNRTQCNAGSTDDAPCVPCTNNPISGEFVWTAGCAFTCKYGLYYSTSLNRCLICNVPTCPPGQKPDACTDTNNNPGCSACTNGPIGTGYTWRDNCEFECNNGLFHSKSTNKCILCTKPACPPGQKAGQCTDQISSPACEACTNRPSTGPFIWANECNFVCTNGTYNNSGKCLPCNTGTYLSSPNGCSPCNTTLCSPGLYRTQCPPGSVIDPSCSKCKTQVTGPFTWTSQCASICVNQTYLLNGTNCTACTEPCPNGTFISSPCTFAEDTKCTQCNVIPQPPDTFTWTGGCNFQCVPGFVWNKSHCLDETVTDMVTIQSSTNMEFNNTVKEVCSNLDLLVYAVTSSMEELYGIPFTGNVTSVNNQTVDAACSNSSGNQTIKTNRRLATAKSSGGGAGSKTTAKVGAKSKTSTTKSGTQTNNGGADTKITEKITTGNNNGKLSLNNVNTETETINTPRSGTTTEQQKTIASSALVAIIVLIVADAFFYCIYRYIYPKQNKNESISKSKTAQFNIPIQPSHYTLSSIPWISAKDPYNNWSNSDRFGIKLY